MNAQRFDSLSRLFAERRLSRRQAIARGGAGVAATTLAATGLPRETAAQEATPAAGPGPRVAEMLFVQTFQAGAITPVEGQEGRYTLSLEAGAGETIYFSDRPDRIVGTTPTPDFLGGLGFREDNPPNAALIIETEPGETDVAVIELYSPLYDPITQGVIYEVEVLANWQTDLNLGLREAPTDLASLAPSFGAAHLFIDDCPNLTISCYQSPSADLVGTFENQPMCWNYSLCIPCEPYGHEQPDRCATKIYWEERCQAEFSACNGDCTIDNDWPFYGLVCPKWSR